jgi:hypothetical protein
MVMLRSCNDLCLRVKSDTDLENLDQRCWVVFDCQPQLRVLATLVSSVEFKIASLPKYSTL